VRRQHGASYGQDNSLTNGDHMRSILKTTAGVQLPLAVGGLEPVYLASRGQVIQVEMTLENRGYRLCWSILARAHS
jgi:hypothetical protein